MESHHAGEASFDGTGVLGPLGRPIRRVEDVGLLTGADPYTGDLVFPDALHVAFVRSTEAHARILGVDTSEALGLDGVVGVYTAADFDLPEMTFPASLFPTFRDLLPPGVHRPALAVDTVRFVGEIVAVVAATSAAVAEDAVEMVFVDYEPLPAIVDAQAAVSDGAPLLFPEVGSNVVADAPHESGERTDRGTVSITTRFHMPRMAVAPMENDAIVAVPEPGTGNVTIHVSAQSPHLLKDAQAGYLGLEPDQLRVICPAVGGGFGGRIPVEVEYTLTIAVARRLGRPVRWVQLRSENLVSMQARDHYFEVTLESTADGELTALIVDSLANLGAYPLLATQLRMTTRSHSSGTYRIPFVEFRTRGVVTNTPPVGAFRGAGRPEGITVIERAMDVLAARLDLDPAELRRRNLIQPEQFPYTTNSGGVYDTGDYEGCLDAALEMLDYDAIRTEQQARRDRGGRQLGIGISSYVEMSAAGANKEFGSVEVQPDGRIRVLIGSSAHGQGHRTAFAQVVGESLGVSIEQIDVIQSDTGIVAKGVGTFGSRSGQLGGSTLKLGAEEVLEKARRLAAHVLEAAPEDVVVVPGEGLGIAGVPTSTLSWAELATIAADPARLPEGMEPGLFADPTFEQVATGTAPFGCHLAVVEVDPQTGRVELQRLVAIDDCGFVINPMIAEGQVHGGLLGGIAETLFEEICYDDAGNPVNASFAEYLFPSAAEMPSFETGHTVTLTPNNPLGAKGLGEAGTTGSVAALYNAVIDAVAHLGVHHLDLPLTPMRVWEAIAAASPAAAGVATR